MIEEPGARTIERLRYLSRCQFRLYNAVGLGRRCLLNCDEVSNDGKEESDRCPTRSLDSRHSGDCQGECVAVLRSGEVTPDSLSQP